MTRRQKSSLPPPDLGAGNVWGADLGRLDLKAPVGRYLIDDHASRIPVSPDFVELGLAAGGWSVRRIRSAVARTGYYAQNRAASVDKDPVTASEARQHQKELEALEARCAIIGRRDIEPIVHHFIPASVDASDEWDDANHRLDEIGRLALELSTAIARMRAEYRVGRAINTGNTSPLEHSFIYFAAIGWRELTGRDPPRARSGPYVEFLGAAWQDLNFPPLGDPVEVLGRINERRPQ